MNNQQGFTLVETLVALLIVAVSYVSVATAVSSFTDQRLMLQQRWNGHRIAWNQLQSQIARSQNLFSGDQARAEEQGDVHQSGLVWLWQMKEESTQAGELLRYRVAVSVQSSPDKALPVAELSAFVVR